MVCNLAISIRHIFLSFPSIFFFFVFSVRLPIPVLARLAVKGGSQLDGGTQRSARPPISFHLWSGLLNGNDRRVRRVRPDPLTAQSLSLWQFPTLSLSKGAEPSRKPRDPHIQTVRPGFRINQLWLYQWWNHTSTSHCKFLKWERQHFYFHGFNFGINFSLTYWRSVKL